MNRFFRWFLAPVFLLAFSAVAWSQGAPTGLALSNDEPIQIESDKFELDDNQSLGVFTGNVSVVQGEMSLRAARMQVHYNNENGGSNNGNGGSVAAGGGQIEKIELDGGVYLSSGDQEATGDAGTFDMNTEVLVLTGEEVVLTEGDNVVVGCRLTVQMATGQATLESCKDQKTNRVRMLLNPRSQDQ
ncbi:LptA/OstA family protein [Chelativorans sp. YIM 93263]|uniref:LptA/OstA family protein n=1 Tax=Chelativorans sp. YIM 93263 TaxID=2906648 RepID=UPI002379CA01|nr:LptA/OstA family protein [Chelativorans sp. YIM 93263]